MIKKVLFKSTNFKRKSAFLSIVQYMQLIYSEKKSTVSERFIDKIIWTWKSIRITFQLLEPEPRNMSKKTHRSNFK